MLTDAQVRGAKAGDSPRKLFDERGLYLQVMPNGGKYWRFNFRFKGKHKTLSLGICPDVPLAKARDRHLEAGQLLADGVDPCAEKQVSNKTFETVAREWYGHRKASRHQRHAHYVLKRLEADVFPEIGTLSLDDFLRASGRRSSVTGSGKNCQHGSESACCRSMPPWRIRGDACRQVRNGRFRPSTVCLRQPRSIITCGWLRGILWTSMWLVLRRSIRGQGKGNR